MNRDNNRSDRPRTPEARADRDTYRDDDAGLYGFYPHRGPEAGPQHGNRPRDQHPEDRDRQQRERSEYREHNERRPDWPRPSQGPPPESDRHINTYESRREPHSPYDEPDFRLNERGQYDEPGYAVDEPYERRPDRNQPQSGWGADPRGQSRTRDGYGPASDNQPRTREDRTRDNRARDDHDRYRPSPYATPPGRPGDGADEQFGRVFDQPHPGEPTSGTTRHARSDADDRIRHELHERFDFDPFLRNAPIDIRVRDRRVTLDGAVNSHRDRDHAEDIAHAVPGTRAVHNHLNIQQRPR
jgi:hypothetical protein